MPSDPTTPHPPRGKPRPPARPRPWPGTGSGWSILLLLVGLLICHRSTQQRQLPRVRRLLHAGRQRRRHAYQVPAKTPSSRLRRTRRQGSTGRGQAAEDVERTKPICKSKLLQRQVRRPGQPDRRSTRSWSRSSPSRPTASDLEVDQQDERLAWIGAAPDVRRAAGAAAAGASSCSCCRASATRWAAAS